MDRKVDFPGQQPGIKLLGPQRLAADFGQWAVQHLVATGGDGNDLYLKPGMGSAQAVAGFVRLGHGKRRGTGTEFQGTVRHGRLSYCAISLRESGHGDCPRN